MRLDSVGHLPYQSTTILARNFGSGKLQIPGRGFLETPKVTDFAHAGFQFSVKDAPRFVVSNWKLSGYSQR